MGLEAAKLAIGLVLMGPQLPMLFMGEEWSTSAPFLYFADHEDEEFRRSVAEGRRREFAAFGFGEDVPNPEDEKSYLDSKLRWDELKGGKHAEMLAWVRDLIRVRRSCVCLNDGDPNHLSTYADEDKRILVLERDEARFLLNFGDQPYTFALLPGEELKLVSRIGIGTTAGELELPGVTLAVLMSDREAMENRQVLRQKRPPKR